LFLSLANCDFSLYPSSEWSETGVYTVFTFVCPSVCQSVCLCVSVHTQSSLQLGRYMHSLSAPIYALTLEVCHSWDLSLSLKMSINHIFSISVMKLQVLFLVYHLWVCVSVLDLRILVMVWVLKDWVLKDWVLKDWVCLFSRVRHLYSTELVLFTLAIAARLVVNFTYCYDWFCWLVFVRSTAVSATKELDDLMASISDLDIQVGLNVKLPF